MTLIDLFRLIKHYWKIAVIVPVVCTIACAGYLLLTKSDDTYSAASILTLTGEAGSFGAIANNSDIIDKDSDMKLTVKTDGGAKTVTITVAGPDPDACVQLSNEIAEYTVKKATTMYETIRVPEVGAEEVHDSVVLAADQTQVLPKPIRVAVTKAEEAEQAEAASRVKYLVVALAGGLFLGICIIVIMGMARAQVISADELQSATELPILGKLPTSDNGERMLANVRFASNADNVTNVCVLPGGATETAQGVCDALAGAVKAEGIPCAIVEAGSKQAADLAAGGMSIVRCGTLKSGVAGAYAAKDADAVVVSVQLWKDSYKDINVALHELALANAKVAGLVVVS